MKQSKSNLAVERREKVLIVASVIPLRMIKPRLVLSKSSGIRSRRASWKTRKKMATTKKKITTKMTKTKANNTVFVISKEEYIMAYVHKHYD